MNIGGPSMSMDREGVRKYLVNKRHDPFSTTGVVKVFSVPLALFVDQGTRNLKRFLHIRHVT